LAPIRRPLPTELPQLALHLERLDRVFELEDGGILHLEFQARLQQADFLRFLHYALALLQAYPGRKIWLVVLCGPGVRLAPLPMHLGELPYSQHYILLGNQDGEAILARLRMLATSGAAWAESDRLDLYLLLLMRHQRDTETVAREGLALAGHAASSSSVLHAASGPRLSFTSVDTMKESMDTDAWPLSEAQIADDVNLAARLNPTYITVDTHWEYPAYMQQWIQAVRVTESSPSAARIKAKRAPSNSHTTTV